MLNSSSFILSAPLTLFALFISSPVWSRNATTAVGCEPGRERPRKQSRHEFFFAVYTHDSHLQPLALLLFLFFGTDKRRTKSTVAHLNIRKKELLTRRDDKKEKNSTSSKCLCGFIIIFISSDKCERFIFLVTC